MGFGKCSLGKTNSLNFMAEHSFWSQQRVFVTGHTGFKGAWLCAWLLRMGARVSGYALAPETVPALYTLLGPGVVETSTLADIRDRSALGRSLKAADPTIVLHLAAQPLVLRSYRRPIETLEVNVLGTANLLEELRGSPSLKAVLVITTDKVYRNLEEPRAFQEDDPLGSHDPYSTSKAAAELVVHSWAQSFFALGGIPVVTARAGNVIGGGDWSEDRLVPDIWRAAQAKEQLVLRYPSATRPWQHVVEPLSGYLRYVEEISTADQFPAALNFGPYADDVLTVAQLTEELHAAWGVKTGWRYVKPSGGKEMRTLALDPRLAERTIGWKPCLNSSRAIAWTAEWYQRFAEGERALDICQEQIARYEEME